MASPLLDLRPGEGRTLLLLGGHLFLVLAGNTLLATAAEALFLARYPYSWMPYTYLAGAFWTVVASFLYGKVKERLSPAGVTRVITAVSVAVLVLTLLVLLVWPAFGPFVLQMLTPAFGVLGGMESAALVARAVSTRQARRLYPAISGIGGVGATIGAYSVAVLSRSMSPLVLVGSTSVFLAAAMLLAVRVRGIEARRDRAKPAPWRDVLANRFSLLLISLVCVSGVLTTCVKFQLSACVKETFTEAQIKVYLGQLYGALNAASIVFGVLVTRLLIRWLGVSASLLVYPLLLLGCGIAGVASPGLVVTSTALFAERLFRQNLQRPLLNIAIMPLPEQLAARATIAIRGAVETPAIALTSIVLLLGASWIPWAAVSYVVAAAALLGVLCVLWARPCYRRELVEALHARRLRLEGVSGAEQPIEVDGAARGLLHAKLLEPSATAVELALGALHGQVSGATVQLVAERWDAWSPATRAAAVAMLGTSEDPDAVRWLAQLDEGEPTVVRAARFAAESWQPAGTDFAAAFAGTSSEIALAAARRARRGAFPGAPADPERVLRWLADPDPAWRACAAVLAAGDGSVSWRKLLAAAPEIALEHAAEHAVPEILPYLLETLGASGDFELRRAALLQIGSAAVPDLLRAMHDPSRASRALAVLATSEDRQARDGVLSALDESDPELRFRALQALLGGGTRLPADRVDSVVGRELDASERYAAARTHPDPMVAREATAAFHAALERLFMALQLGAPSLPYRRVQLSLAADSVVERSFAVEALDEMLPAPLRQRLLPLLDSGMPRTEHAAAAAVDADPLLTRISALRGGGMQDPTMARCLELADSPLFASFHIADLLVLVEAAARHATLGRGMNVPERGSAAAVARALLDDPKAQGVPLAAIWETVIRRPHAATAWLRGLASVLVPLAAEAADVTQSGVSLASQAGAKHDEPAPGGEDLEVWRRMFYLRRVALLAGLAAPRLRLLASICRSLAVTAGTRVVLEGRPAYHAYVVVRGTFQVTSAGQRLALVGESEAFGMMALLTGRERSATVTAVEPGELLALERTDFADLLATHPGMVRSVSRQLARWVRDTGQVRD